MEFSTADVPRVFLVLGIALLAGCVATPNKSYWTSGEDGTGRPLIPADIDAKTFHPRLAVIEFDEQGDFWSAAQIRRATKMISSTNRRPLVVTFVHGWHNNARPDNHDLQTFNNLLLKLQNSQSFRDKMDVCGIFIAWRGESYDPRFDWTLANLIGRYATFYSRKEATDRMAGVPLTTVISDIAKAAREHTPRGITVFIGHSFGGRILERVVGQAIVAQSAIDRDGKAELPADFILLINPASESLFAFELKRALRKWPKERPAIVTVRSETDVATGEIWRKGMTLGSWGGGYRTYRFGSRIKDNQRSFITTTSGSDPRQITHILAERASNVCPQNGAFSYNLESATPKLLFVDIGRDQENICASYSLTPVNPKEVEKADYQIPSEAYWIVKVPDEVLKGHGGDEERGGIFSQPTIDVFAALFHIAHVANIRSSPTVPLTPAAEQASASIGSDLRE